jgi:hypothetical protein
MPLDLDALEARLAEYNPDAPRCQKKVEEHRNFAPSGMEPDDPAWDDYTVTHFAPCCRPEGHEGECRNSRRVLGWPGYATLKELLDEVRHLRRGNTVLEAKLDACGQANLGLRIQCRRAEAETIRMTEKHDRLHERLMGIERANVDSWKNGYAAAQRQIAAWLRDLGNRTHDDDGLRYHKAAASVLRHTAEAIERGDHRKEEP